MTIEKNEQGYAKYIIFKCCI